MAIVRSVFAWTVALLATIVFGSLAILTSWIPPRGRVYLFWARSWSRVVLLFAGIPLQVESAEATERLPAAIFMPNHESAIDILTLLLAVPHEIRFLAKRSLFYVPFMGWSMWLAGFIPVDRENKHRAKDVLDELASRIREGHSIIVFPEGTRSRSGELGEFKKSGFLLALKTGLPIVPIGIRGARRILGTEGMKLGPGHVRITLGEPIETKGLGVSHRAELMARVRAEILRLRGNVP